jgi:hypothetical protein
MWQHPCRHKRSKQRRSRTNQRAENSIADVDSRHAATIYAGPADMNSGQPVVRADAGLEPIVNGQDRHEWS